MAVPSSWWVTRQARAFVGQKIHLQNSLAAAGHIIAACSRKPSSCGENYRRLPFISGLTIIGAHENESPQQSYRRLAEQLRRFGSDPVTDAKELWRRMVFNILCNNNDDHLRNHDFLWDGKGWRLSPAYDIVPAPQVWLERDLAIGVGRNGRQATLRNALSDVASFGLSRHAADGEKCLGGSLQAPWLHARRNRAPAPLLRRR